MASTETAVSSAQGIVVLGLRQHAFGLIADGAAEDAIGVGIADDFVG